MNKHIKRLVALSLMPLSFSLFAEDANVVDAMFTASPTELRNSWQIKNINAPYLWNLKVSGMGVKIGEIGFRKLFDILKRY